ncbi:uncharacterized protein LOC111458611 [Cucurbita moschata]|uniref:Uncharacterized protein LOC111458611 n=1 Tax=Cucurbita moschata TaxID=3662 RepID=A0A6J1H139_CUCMO|nr:uncharacterized protein LOC111458611 [Cucurbita moschata]
MASGGGDEVEVNGAFIGAGCNIMVNNVPWGACDLVAFGAQNAVAIAIFSPKVPRKSKDALPLSIFHNRRNAGLRFLFVLLNFRISQSRTNFDDTFRSQISWARSGDYINSVGHDQVLICRLLGFRRNLLLFTVSLSSIFPH